MMAILIFREVLLLIGDYEGQYYCDEYNIRRYALVTFLGKRFLRAKFYFNTHAQHLIIKLYL